MGIMSVSDMSIKSNLQLFFRVVSCLFQRLFQRSSVVERSAVNRLVVGSNPTAGANSKCFGFIFFRIQRAISTSGTQTTFKPESPVIIELTKSAENSRGKTGHGL